MKKWTKKKILYKVQSTDDTHRYKELQLHRAQVKAACVCLANMIQETGGGQDTKDLVH